MIVRVYQLDANNEQAASLMFRYFGTFEKKNLTKFEKNMKPLYRCVYEDNREKYTGNVRAYLEELFEEFNINKPSDYKGHSLSVSDVIQLDDEYYFVDCLGYEEV